MQLMIEKKIQPKNIIEADSGDYSKTLDCWSENKKWMNEYYEALKT